MSSESNGVKIDSAQSQGRLKKIAAKTFQLKSPPPHAAASADVSSSESFKSAVTAEVFFQNDGVNGGSHDDAIPPARRVAALSSPVSLQPQSAKKAKSAPKHPPRKKAKSAKPLKGGFWEVESIVDVRKNGSRFEYLVQWKGDYENTWEPEKCLNPSARRDAEELKAKMQQQQSDVGAVVSSVSIESIQTSHESGDGLA